MGVSIVLWLPFIQDMLHLLPRMVVSYAIGLDSYLIFLCCCPSNYMVEIRDVYSVLLKKRGAKIS